MAVAHHGRLLSTTVHREYKTELYTNGNTHVRGGESTETSVRHVSSTLSIVSSSVAGCESVGVPVGNWVGRMVVSGVSVGFTKDMEIVGVGYRGALQGKVLSLNLGLSHSVEIDVPEGIQVKMDGNTKFTISSADKQKLGEFASMVRSKRPPEPFKGKGIRYANEFILRKEGKKK